MKEKNIIEFEPKRRKVFGKEQWVATLHTTGTISLEEVCRLVAANSTAQPSEVEGLIRAYLHQIRFYVINGQRVKVENLGTFYPRVSTRYVDNIDNVSIDNCVRSIVVGYTPSAATRKLMKASTLRLYSAASNAVNSDEQ